MKRLGKLLQPIYTDDGQMIGRATLTGERWQFGTAPGGMLMVGGFASTGMSGITGVLLGTVRGAAREFGIPLLDSKQLQDFATGEIPKLKKIYKDPVSQHSLAVTVRQLGGVPNELPVTQSAHGWLTPTSLSAWAASLEEIFMIDRYILTTAQKYGPKFSLGPNVLACESGYSGILHSDNYNDWPNVGADHDRHRTMMGFIVDCVADAWRVPRKKLYDKAMRRFARKTIGIVGEEPIFDQVIVLTRKNNYP